VLTRTANIASIRLIDDRLVVRWGIAYRWTTPMSLPYRKYQVRGLCICYKPESAPFRHGILHVILSGSICSRTRQRLACVRANYDRNGLRIEHEIGKYLLFLIFRTSEGN
jgi:hypothetical protein